jgi:hypothetical protein
VKGPIVKNARNGQQAPGSVAYASGVLRVQAGCWGIMSALCMLGVAENAAAGSAAGAAGFALAGLIAGTFAVLKVRLGRRLLAASARARKVAIGVEISMTSFGALGVLASSTPDGAVGLVVFFLPFAVGTGLSLGAVIGLLRPPARQYFAVTASTPPPVGEPSAADGSDPASFWHPRAARWQPRLLAVL